MKKNAYLTIALIVLLPIPCLANDANRSGYNWGLIIGSIIVGGIFSLAISIEQNKNTKRNMWYKEMHMPKTAKFIKNIIAALGFYFLYIFVATLLFPNQRDWSRILLSVITTILTIFIHKKFFNRNAQKNKT